MANTFTLIASSTVGAGGASSIDFTSIPSTYTDLVLVCSLRVSRASVVNNTVIKFNGSSTSYSERVLYGNGSSAGSYSDTQIYDVNNAANSTASTFANSQFYIPNYAGSTNKSVSNDSVSETNATAATAQLVAGLWSNTSAITSISLTDYSGTNFVQYSTAYLYGVKNA
jgi:hypothetical protein